ncbi:hypothetical protein J4468_01865 [Candidatus Woesearchaeota archaeon]|nr:hypothetical protein [Candidatus Woesearchaeota archaeon]
MGIFLRQIWKGLKLPLFLGSLAFFAYSSIEMLNFYEIKNNFSKMSYMQKIQRFDEAPIKYIIQNSDIKEYFNIVSFDNFIPTAQKLKHAGIEDKLNLLIDKGGYKIANRQKFEYLLLKNIFSNDFTAFNFRVESNSFDYLFTDDFASFLKEFNYDFNKTDSRHVGEFYLAKQTVAKKINELSPGEAPFFEIELAEKSTNYFRKVIHGIDSKNYLKYLLFRNDFDDFIELPVEEKLEMRKHICGVMSQQLLPSIHDFFSEICGELNAYKFYSVSSIAMQHAYTLMVDFSKTKPHITFIDATIDDSNALITGIYGSKLDVLSSNYALSYGGNHNDYKDFLSIILNIPMGLDIFEIDNKYSEIKTNNLYLNKSNFLFSCGEKFRNENNLVEAKRYFEMCKSLGAEKLPYSSSEKLLDERIFFCEVIQQVKGILKTFESKFFIPRTYHIIIPEKYSDPAYTQSLNQMLFDYCQ